MIPQIKKILYATDLSENSTHVFRYAINSAQKHDAKIIIVHVLEQMSVAAGAIAYSFIPQDHLKKRQEEAKIIATDRIQKSLKFLCETEFSDDLQCAERVESIEVCEGFAPDKILRMADEKNCDAIIMGTHAKGVIANTFLGSTAKRVLRRTRTPVLIIPLLKGDVDIAFDDI